MNRNLGGLFDLAQKVLSVICLSSFVLLHDYLAQVKGRQDLVRSANNLANGFLGEQVLM